MKALLLLSRRLAIVLILNFKVLMQVVYKLVNVCM